MKIAVCVKWVADLDSVDVNPLTGEVDLGRLLYVLDPGAESALAMALRLGGEIVAYTVGLGDSALRVALAAGVHRVVRIEAAPRPALTASLLARAIAADGPFDRILTGTRSFDRGSGEVPSLLAEALGLPVVTDVVAIGKNEVERELDGGTREIVRIEGAAVIALGPDVARIGIASLPNLMKSQKATIEVRRPDAAALATDPVILERIELPPRPRVRTVRAPEGSPGQRLAAITQGVAGQRSRGRMLEGPPGEMADAIVAFLRERGIFDALR